MNLVKKHIGSDATYALVQVNLPSTNERPLLCLMCLAIHILWETPFVVSSWLDAGVDSVLGIKFEPTKIQLMPHGVVGHLGSSELHDLERNVERPVVITA